MSLQPRPYVRTDVLTVIVFIDVEPDRAHDFVARVREMITSFTRHQPGFVSSAMHLSEDKTRLLNYSQWQGREAFLAFRAHPEAERHIADLEAIAIRLDAKIMEPEFIVAERDGPVLT